MEGEADAQIDGIPALRSPLLPRSTWKARSAPKSTGSLLGRDCGLDPRSPDSPRLTASAPRLPRSMEFAVSRCKSGARYPWKARRDDASALDPRSTWKVRQIGGSGSWQSPQRRPPHRPVRCRRPRSGSRPRHRRLLPRPPETRASMSPNPHPSLRPPRRTRVRL